MKNLNCFLITLLLLIVGVGSIHAINQQKPNVIIIYTDDQGMLDAGCYGSTDLHTPNIDKLSKTGIRFTQAYAHTVCCPSRIGLLTGRAPQRTGINRGVQNDAHDKKKGRNLPLSEVTIAEVLKENGYRTGAFGKWHLGGHLENGPLEQGFDTFWGHRGGFIDNYTHYFLHRNGFHDLWDNKKEIFRRGEFFPSLMTEQALQFIEDNKTQPFFMYAAFNLPHYPEQAEAKFTALYEELEQPRKSYAAVVSTVDDKVGQIIEKLEKLGIRDNTIMFFMSDNGHSTEDGAIQVDYHNSGIPKNTNYCANGGGGNTGKWRGAKSSFLEGGVRVPAIISYPGRFLENIVRDQIITNMDFFPTICELTGAKKPDCILDGHSLIPVIKSNENSEYKVLYFKWNAQGAVREGKWKLILNGLDTTGKFSKHPEKERIMEPVYLANLEDKNPEEINYAAKYPEVVERLTNMYNTWVEEMEDNQYQKN